MPNLYQFRPSSSQRSLWLAHQLDAGSSAYNIAHAWRLLGPLDRQALERALNDLIARHESLRTSFCLGDAGLVQQVWSERPVPLVATELAAGVCGDADASLEVFRGEARRPFDLDRDPLLRAHLFCLGKQHYVFVLTLHHIVVDGWSMDILWEELSQAYASHRAGEPWTPAELPLQYADYAEWQHDWLDSQQARQGLDHWTGHLAGACPTVALPGMKVDAGSGRRRHVGETVRFVLPPAPVNALADTARRHRTTVFVTVFAALHVLLHRLSRQDDLCVGYAVANRRQADTHALIGCFINTLVLRTRPRGDQTFEALVEQVRELVLQGEAHQETPFEQVVQALSPDRVTDGTPLFQVAFGFRNHDRRQTPFALQGMTTEAMALQPAATKFDLSFDVEHDPSGLAVEIQFDHGLYARDAVERMAGHFEALLTAIAAAPSTELRHLSLTTPARALPMSVARHHSGAADLSPESVVRAFEAQVRRTPQTTALVADDGVWSYAKLNQRANQIAAHLRRQSLVHDDIVAVLLERRGDLIASMLGIMKAGAAYLPLDPHSPTERMLRVLAQARAKTVVSTSELCGHLRDAPVKLVCLDEAASEIAGADACDPEFDVALGQLAYCLFTSGSTGQPKGVMIEHQALGNLLSAMSRSPGTTVDDVWLSVTSPTFDIFGLEIYLPLTAGATVVLAGRDEAGDPVALAELARRHGVTAMQATPATWRMWTEQPGCPRLRTALCGGEAMDQGLASRLQQVAETVWNVYGPTETTIWSTRSRVQGLRSPDLGHPIENTDVMVLDDCFRLLPAGVAGEIFIAGDGLARGYVNQPGLTAERFLPNPFGPPGRRMYRTGDWGYMQADGALVYLDRTDFQVKVRGFRIELGEIEAALRSHHQVRDAVVVAAGIDMASRRLVAYVVPRRDDANALRQDILQHLGALLPAYMLPTQIQFLLALPLSASGKIDRKALPAPESVAVSTGGRAPATPTEIRVASIWSGVLDAGVCHVDDNFFALGGTSMLAMRCLARINASFGLAARPSLVFECQTIESLARAIDSGQEHPPRSVRITSWAERSSARRVYGFPAAGMYGAAYFDLARALAPELDLCMIEPLEPDESDTQPVTIEALAEHFAAALPASDPDSPIVLLGHSFGASVAFETARRLERRGKAVHLVVLDATLVSPLELAESWGDGPEEALAADTELEQLLAATSELHARHWDMLTRYKPSAPFAGDMLVLFARDDLLKARFDASILSHCRAWVRGQVSEASTPGTHLSILDADHVGAIAELISRHLDQHWPLSEAALAPA